MPRKVVKNPKEEYHIFSTRLKDLMQLSKTTQTELAEHIGCTRQVISLYTTAQSVPDAINLGKLADFFKVSTDYLLGRTNVMKVDITSSEIEKKLGLSEQAMVVLQKNKDYDKGFLNALNFLLEQEFETDLNCRVLWKITGFLNTEIPDGKMYEIVNNDIIKRESKVYTQITDEYNVPVRKLGFSLKYLTHSLMLDVIQDNLRTLKMKYQQQKGATNGQHNETE